MTPSMKTATWANKKKNMMVIIDKRVDVDKTLGIALVLIQKKISIS